MRMHDRIVKKILKNKTQCVFISPHLDDVVLSCSGLIMELKDKIKVQVITIFTEADSGKETEFARWFVKVCGYNDSKAFFRDRREEDKTIFENLKIDFRHFNFIDAAWRKKPFNKLILKLLENLTSEVQYIYPTSSEVFGGKISPFDSKNQAQLKKELKFTISNKETIVFIPMGIGGHVDHLLTREICKNNFKKIIYWSDFPYSLRSQPDEEFIKANHLSSFAWSGNLEIKKKLISLYSTQFDSLFPSGEVPTIDEVYFFSETDFDNLR